MAFFKLFLFCQISLAAIFGIDDRYSITPNSGLQKQFDATAIGVITGLLTTKANGKIGVEVSNSKDYLCKNQKFYAENYLSYACSGFLIQNNILITAGHCAVNKGEVKNESANYCQAYQWWFGFDTSYKSGEVELSPDALYKCKKIIYAVRDETAPFRDFAIIELDRPVPNVKPFSIGNSFTNQSSLSMIGYPLGLSAKLSHNASILKNDPTKEIFITNLDAFEGNSGSVVFDKNDHVIGLLRGGYPIDSLITNNANSCEIYNWCDNAGKNCLYRNIPAETNLPGFQQVGSEVQRIESVMEQWNLNK